MPCQFKLEKDIATLATPSRFCWVDYYEHTMPETKDVPKKALIYIKEFYRLTGNEQGESLSEIFAKLKEKGYLIEEYRVTKEEGLRLMISK